MHAEPCDPNQESPESIRARKDASIVEIKSMRAEMDGAFKNLKKAVSNGQIHERSLAITKLQEVIMAASGMDLTEMGAPNPYPNSYNPGNTIIDKTADGLKL